MNVGDLSKLLGTYYDGLRDVYAGKPLPSGFGGVLSQLHVLRESENPIVELHPFTHTMVAIGGEPPKDIVEHILAVARHQLNDPSRRREGTEKSIADLESLLAERDNMDAQIAKKLSEIDGGGRALDPDDNGRGPWGR